MIEHAESILIVEDDAAIREGLELNLRLEGYHVRATDTVADGVRLVREAAPDLVLLDLMLPDGSGLELLRRLRRDEELRSVWVLILSALGMESDRVRGLRLGADDYICKPFGLAEVLARVEAALRRTRRERRTTIHFGEVVIDPVRHEVQRAGALVSLTRREFSLLLHLASHPNRVFSREQLLSSVWGPNYAGTSRTVDNFVSSLRGKLERDPARPVHLLTVHGLGYKLAR